MHPAGGGGIVRSRTSMDLSGAVSTTDFDFVPSIEDISKIRLLIKKEFDEPELCIVVHLKTNSVASQQ